jgi:hypothetical protein
MGIPTLATVENPNARWILLLCNVDDDNDDDDDQ